MNEHQRNLRRDSLHDWSMYFGGIGTGFGIVGGFGIGWTWAVSPGWLYAVAAAAVAATLVSVTLHILRGRVPR